RLLRGRGKIWRECAGHHCANLCHRADYYRLRHCLAIPSADFRPGRPVCFFGIFGVDAADDRRAILAAEYEMGGVLCGVMDSRECDWGGSVSVFSLCSGGDLVDWRGGNTGAYTCRDIRFWLNACRTDGDYFRNVNDHRIASDCKTC